MKSASDALTLAALVAPATPARAQSGCSNSSVHACIVQAAREYHQPIGDALGVAHCESTDDPLATNGTDDGLFQIAPETYATTPYRRRSIWQARWNALAAMFLWATGHKNEWACR